MGLSLSSLVRMSVCVYCSIREKVFPFYCIFVHTFSYLSLPSCYIWTGTLLIDWPSYYWDVDLKFSVFNGCLWVMTVFFFQVSTPYSCWDFASTRNLRKSWHWNLKVKVKGQGNYQKQKNLLLVTFRQSFKLLPLTVAYILLQPELQWKCWADGRTDMPIYRPELFTEQCSQ